MELHKIACSKISHHKPFTLKICGFRRSQKKNKIKKRALEGLIRPSIMSHKARASQGPPTPYKALQCLKALKGLSLIRLLRTL